VVFRGGELLIREVAKSLIIWDLGIEESLYLQALVNSDMKKV